MISDDCVAIISRNNAVDYLYSLSFHLRWTFESITGKSFGNGYDYIMTVPHILCTLPTKAARYPEDKDVEIQ